MKVLVTGADGFVGSRVVARLRQASHEVVAAVRPGASVPPAVREATLVPLELRDEGSVRKVAECEVDGVIHLAAVASGSDARKDPSGAWETNAVGAGRLAQAVAVRRPRFLLVSTAEVYGAGPPTPRVETDPTQPCSDYAASKLAGETAVLAVHQRDGLPVVIARPFPHTGRGQDQRFVVPALAARIQIARERSAPAVKVGNLTPVRELMHVEDVIDAYLLLLERGVPGEAYNVASGRGVSLEQVYRLLCDLAGYHPVPEVDQALMRPADIPYLVGNGAKLQARTGWTPRHSLEDTLAEVLNAQAN